ncbi:MAG: signal peptidase I [Candidatus Wallbacteria bacterium]|nr:signal peptidase I [Candidatus Wallbacteria bacterium]
MNRKLHPESDRQPNPWLQSVDLVGERRSFSGHRLRYHPVVPVDRLRLRLVLQHGVAQQLVMEHRTPDRVLATDILAVEHGKIEWPVRLLRGWNRIQCWAPGEPSKTFALDLVHRSPLREWLETVLFALAFALLIRTFLLQVFVLPIDSSMDSLSAGDRILVNRLHYALSRPATGDLAVLEYSRPRAPGEPADSVHGADARFVIKRIGAVAGQSLATRGHEIVVDGKALGPPFDSLRASAIPTAELPVDVPQTQVPPGALFLVSSNRSASGKPAVWWGFLTERSVLGRAFATLWPWNRRCWVR